MAAMIPVADHASEISKILAYAKDPVDWTTVADWLAVASGVISVQFDSIRFDDGFGWCSGADEFVSAREELLQKCVTELTRFTYCWGALEGAIDVIQPPHAPQRGKINDACFFLRSHSVDDTGFACYQSVLADVRHCLVTELSNEDKVLARFQAPAFVSLRGLGMYVIYKLRNNFFHGLLQFPLPDGDHKAVSPYTTLLPLATRLTLLSIQHLIAAAHDGYSETWETTSDEGQDVEQEFHAQLSTLHLPGHEESDQRRLL